MLLTTSKAVILDPGRSRYTLVNGRYKTSITDSRIVGDMTDTLQEFVDKLLETELLEQADIDKHCQAQAGQGADYATSLARDLIKADLITRFQARQILQNKHHRLLLGNYHLIDKIGQGGMGEVFKARHRRMKRIVAIKVLTEKVTRSSVRLRRFQREVEAAARLVHPNIVTAFDADKDAGIFYLVMEYVNGRDLGAVVKEDGPFDPVTAVDYVIQAARGLEYAHGEGVVHRDIKPHNLLVDENGNVKVLDMGLVSFDTDQRTTESSESLTENNQIIGTLDYMSPEQAEDVHRVDARTDIYSLGCTLYRLLTGNSPFEGKNAIQKLMAHRTHPIPSLRRARGGIPELLDRVFQKMLAKKVEDRYQSMGEVIEALEACSMAMISIAPIPTESGSESQRDTARTYDGGSTLDLHTRVAALPKVAPLSAADGATNRVHVGSSRTISSERQRQRDRSSPILMVLSAMGILGLLGLAWFLSQPTQLVLDWPVSERVGATLRINGREIEFGDSVPLEIDVRPGSHEVLILRYGFYPFKQQVEVAKRSQVHVTPEWEESRLPTMESNFGSENQ